MSGPPEPVRYDWLTTEMYEEAARQMEADWQAFKPIADAACAAFREINDQEATDE